MEHWTVGELAKAGGITARTLHHYDEIGLLTPSVRNAQGHRLYTDDDVRRLYRIRALGQLGVPLDRVGAALDRDTPALRDLLSAQLADLDARAHRLDELRARLNTLLTDPDPTSEALLGTLEVLTLYDTYLTPEQRDALAARRTELGEQRIDDLREEWVEVLTALRRHQQAGTPVTDPEVTGLVTRWDEIGSRFHPGDDTPARARALWRDHGDRISDRVATGLGWEPTAVTDVVTYLETARRT
ncbi:MAG: MerR family transcriptional regulator [Saccharothrix sp.]|nr:MerR family transcriptional regulator [Saccharothrix sp.]